MPTLYLGIYAFTKNLNVTMSVCFKDQRNCRGIMKKEMKRRHQKYMESIGMFDLNKLNTRDLDQDDTEDEEHHHHHNHKHDDEIDHLHAHDCQKCAVCTRLEMGDQLTDWLKTMRKFIEQL